jgi:hypothetical protein
MHQLFVWYSVWSPAIYSWARTAVGIVLWFWVLSGAVFALRFLAFVLLDKSKGRSPLAASSAVLHFPPDHFEGGSPHRSQSE